MNDPVCVGLVQGVGNLNSEPESLLERQGPPGESVRQRLPFQVLHDEVLDAVLVAHVVERADVRMREQRDRLGLSLKPLLDFR